MSKKRVIKETTKPTSKPAEVPVRVKPSCFNDTSSLRFFLLLVVVCLVLSIGLNTYLAAKVPVDTGDRAGMAFVPPSQTLDSVNGCKYPSGCRGSGCLCIDTDCGGAGPSTKVPGKVYFIKNGIINELKDTCATAGSIKEYFCDNTGASVKSYTLTGECKIDSSGIGYLSLE